MMSCGPFADSRLPRLRAVAPVVDRPMLYVPLPVMRGVTSTVVHVAALAAPDEPVFAAPNAGALANVMDVSPQLVSATF